MVLVVEMKPTIEEEEHAAPTIEPTALLLKAVIQDSPREVSIDGALTEMAPKMGVERCFEKDPTGGSTDGEGG